MFLAAGALLGSARALWVGFVVTVVLFAAVGTAQARPRHAAKVEVQSAGASGSAYLGKRGGYRVDLFMGANGVAILGVRRFGLRNERGSIAAVLYAVHLRGSLASGTVRARFGSLGSLSLRFRPNGRVRDEGVRRGCEGPSTITEHGRFVGKVTFHGEDDYLDFSLPGGSGELTRSPELICKKGQALNLPPRRLRAYVALHSFFSTEGDIALLYASARRHGRFIGVTAGHREESPPGAELRFGTFESRRAMAIGRYALVGGPQGTLLTSLPGERPAAATLAPSAPFFGEAHYRETSPHAGVWTGNLGIDLAGLKLPLTGQGFHARLCVVNPVQTPRGCDFFKAPPVYDERPARPWWMSR
jgi:hypothetical protein